MVTLVADKLETQWLQEVCFGIEDYTKATQEAAARFILQPQYIDNPINIILIHYL